MNYKLIAAIDKNRAIGLNNAIPWHLPDDFLHFKKTTLNGMVLMGSKTAKSLGRALPDRDNVVLTRTGKAPYQNMTPVASLAQAEALATQLGHSHIWVIGGEDIYTQTLPLADELVISHVNVMVPEADTFFPVLGEEWEMVHNTYWPKGNGNTYSFEIVRYQKTQN